jgi:hypothetical protein
MQNSMLKLNYNCEVSQLDAVVEFGEMLCYLAVSDH